MGFIAGIVFLLVVDTGIGLGARALRDHAGDHAGVRFRTIVLVCVAAPVVHVFASLPLAASLDLGDPGGRLHLCVIVVACGLYPMFMLAFLFMDSAAHALWASIFGLTTSAPLPSDLSRARSAVRDGDIEEAIRQYQLAFRQNAGEPLPLYELAELLLKEGRPDEAIRTLRGLVADFRDNLHVWSRSAFHLAAALESIGDTSAAKKLRQEILRRAPDTEYARWVHEQNTPDFPDPFLVAKNTRNAAKGQGDRSV